MTNTEKKDIAATARDLITLLYDCDDSEFVDLVVECVASSDRYPLQEENL